MTTNITKEQREMFDALVSGQYRNFALFSCFVNGEPGAAIVAVNEIGGRYDITPLFVTVTPAMALTDHHGRAPDEIQPNPSAI